MKKNPSRTSLGTNRDLPATYGHPQHEWLRSVCPISMMLRRTSVLAAALLGFGTVLLAQNAKSGGLKLKSGKQIFLAGCITCHGPDGKGMPKTTLGFEPPATFPDFTDCRAPTREPDLDWKAIITHGGPSRGFSEIMPSFGAALTPEQIEMVIWFLRDFCRDASWPRGDLNLPRALIAEKAFPEDEAVFTTAINAKGASGTDHAFTYERRFGARNQMEVNFPFSFKYQDTGTWFGGVGDIALGYKRLIFSNLRTGSILSVQGEAILPTGNRARDFGTGVTILETFASYGQLLPNRSFFQFQSGVEVPTDTANVNRAVYWRTLFGKSLHQGMGLGRMWTPMIELLADRELATGEKTNWDLVPQFQVTLSRRQHIRANIGVRLPANDFHSRPAQVMFYLLWDWFDGGLREGW
jgi:mono/diheme cytochrome c family protein